MSQHGLDLDGLNPISESERPMGPISYMLVMWSSVIIVQIMVIGTFLLQDGLNLYQTMTVGLVSGVIISLFATLNGTPGLKYGIPFAVQVRSSFGYRGAVFPHVIRAIPAIAWYGIGSWIGALAIDSIMRTSFQAPRLVFVYFIIFIALQTVLAYKGITSIKWFDASVSFIIIIMLIYFIYHVLAQGNLDFATYTSAPGSWGLLFWGGVAAAIANLATVIVNSSDIIRHIKPATSGANSFANFAGIIPPWMFMFVIGAFVFMGTGVDQPIDGLIALSPSPVFGIILLTQLSHLKNHLKFNADTT